MTTINHASYYRDRDAKKMSIKRIKEKQSQVLFSHLVHTKAAFFKVPGGISISLQIDIVIKLSPFKSELEVLSLHSLEQKTISRGHS